MPPPRPSAKCERPNASLLRQRHHIPSCAWNVLNCGLRWNNEHLGQGCEDQAQEYVPSLFCLLCFLARSVLRGFQPILTKLPAFDAAPGPITATAFNKGGNILAYAVSYDWSKGHSGMTPNHPNKIMLHACKDEEVKKRPAKR